MNENGLDYLRKSIQPILNETRRRYEFKQLPTEEKIKYYKEKYGLTHGKGKRKCRKK